MHLQKSTSCWHFFRARMPAAGDHSGSAFDNCLLILRPIRSLAEDANALLVSSQCTIRLCCDFVNDNFSTSESNAHPFDDACVRRFPVSPQAPHHACASPPPPIFPYSTNQKWTVALLKLLDDMNAPDYAFKAILTWVRAAIADGFSFQPEGGTTHCRNVE